MTPKIQEFGSSHSDTYLCLNRAVLTNRLDFSLLLVLNGILGLLGCERVIHSNQSTIEIVSNTRETSFDSFDDRVMYVERATLEAIVLDVAEDDIRHCNIFL